MSKMPQARMLKNLSSAAHEKFMPLFSVQRKLPELSCGMTNLPYHQRPARSNREFRNLVVERFPALVSHPDGHTYFNMLQYVLWSTVTDRDTGKLLMPYATVADIVGMKAHNKRFRASEWIETFSKDVFPLNPTEYRYVDRKARCIRPDTPKDILAAHRLDGQAEDRKDWVWFTDGATVSRRRLRQTLQEEEDAIIGIARAAVKDHPASELMDYLVTQPQDCLQRVLARNWPAVKGAVFAMLTETPKQIATRDWSERVLNSLRERRTIYYGTAQRRPRIYAIGSTVHLLPRQLRKLALAGGAELDLRAAQLAIVSRLWDIPNLRTFLGDWEKRIWDELSNWVGVPAENKPILKATNYSVVFGMGMAEVRNNLAHGTVKDEGIGEAGATQFFSHLLVRDLITARSRVMR